MDWKNIHYRHVDRANGDLNNGDICVCRLEEGCNWNFSKMCLAVYWDGDFYDSQVKEDNILPHDSWKLVYEDGSYFVRDYFRTGENVIDINSCVVL